MTPIALAGLAALLVAVATGADEPTAQSAVAAETSKSDDQRSRSEGLIAKQYAQIRAEFEAEQAAHRQAAIEAESTRDKRDLDAKFFVDAVRLLPPDGGSGRILSGSPGGARRVNLGVQRAPRSR